MREITFVRQNAAAWQAFERLLDTARPDPDRLASGYIRLMDDLAWARTFYPRSNTTLYLNDLAARVHDALYRNKREEGSRLVTFWTHELPRLVYAERRHLLASLAFFLGAFFIGVLSAAGDGTFVRLILGDGYVNMTLENIAQGDPMAVYKQANEVDMFLGITFNNIRVSFLAFVLGVFASVGTLWVLVQNGVMVGAFQFFFYRHGVFWESVQTIWIHGTLEISAIILAGGAGLVMGNALLLPGTYPRQVAFLRGAKNGLKLVMGLVPMFLVAGFLEGFVTRLTEMPVPLSALIIGASLAFVLWYFVWLPRQVHRADEAAKKAESGPSLAS